MIVHADSAQQGLVPANEGRRRRCSLEYYDARYIFIQKHADADDQNFPGGTGAEGYVKDSVFENFWSYDCIYGLDIDQCMPSSA